MRRSLLRLRLPLRQPFVTSTGVLAERDLVVVRLEDDEGVQGFGEAAPLASYDGERLDEQVWEALREGPPPRGAPPQARTAWEMAELDLQTRRREKPLAPPGADAIPVNWTLAAGPPDEVAEAAKDAVRRGYACMKLKIGLPDDAERVAAVREAIGSWPALRVDANGAFTVDEAAERMAQLEPFDLQLVEQPCATLEEMAELRPRIGVPVAADESVRTADDVRDAARLQACEAVNVKLSAAGGFLPARDAVRAARDTGLEVWLSSTLDGPWGIAAALQLAASEEVSLACGLATLELFDARIARALPPPGDGLMAVPTGPGLGVEVDEDALAEVLVEKRD